MMRQLLIEIKALIYLTMITAAEMKKKSNNI